MAARIRPSSRRPRTTPEAEGSPFEAACRSGELIVTVEIAPPDLADLLARTERFRCLVHGMNIIDGGGGNCHMSSVAASLFDQSLAPALAPLKTRLATS